MATEIERKFLLTSDAWRALVKRSEVFRQGYLNNNKQASVRVRVAGDHANLNIKGMTIGLERLEYEYAIPLDEANELLLKLCERPLIEKTRHIVEYAGKIWEIDEFCGENTGLIVAEVELTATDERISLPDWIGRDVSHLERYYNVCLTKYPYSHWSAEERG